jgi:LmbE family N-acetylglucosaminyl deacetylase
MGTRSGLVLPPQGTFGGAPTVPSSHSTHIGVKQALLMRPFVGSFQSLQKLFFGQIDSINSIDGAASFTLSTLTSAISQILAARAPDNIRTQDYLRAYDGSDHSDHLTVARITQQVAGTTPLTGYMAYPIQVRSMFHP